MYLLDLLLRLRHHIRVRVTVGRDHLLSRAQLLQKVLVLQINQPDHADIDDRRLLFVERGSTGTEVVQRLATTRYFRSDILDLVTLP